ncbi:MAG: hypothetical protein AABZ32_02400, partial [Bacteroidota bacterium]
KNIILIEKRENNITKKIIFILGILFALIVFNGIFVLAVDYQSITQWQVQEGANRIISDGINIYTASGNEVKKSSFICLNTNLKTIHHENENHHQPRAERGKNIRQVYHLQRRHRNLQSFR